MNEIIRAQRRSHALVHWVTARASLFTDLKMLGLSMRAKYKHFRTEQIVSKPLTILRQIPLLLLL